MNYLLSDMLIRIKNGYVSKKINVVVRHSYFCVKVLEMLYSHGFINGYFIIGNNAVVKLKYYQNDHVFKNLNIVSKPGRRIYCSVKEIKKKYYYKNFVLVSNKYGIMTHRESITNNCGGEVLFTLNYS